MRGGWGQRSLTLGALIGYFKRCPRKSKGGTWGGNSKLSPYLRPDALSAGRRRQLSLRAGPGPLPSSWRSLPAPVSPDGRNLYVYASDKLEEEWSVPYRYPYFANDAFFFPQTSLVMSATYDS